MFMTGGKLHTDPCGGVANSHPTTLQKGTKHHDARAACALCSCRVWLFPRTHANHAAVASRSLHKGRLEPPFSHLHPLLQLQLAERRARCVEPTLERPTAAGSAKLRRRHLRKFKASTFHASCAPASSPSPQHTSWCAAARAGHLTRPALLMPTCTCTVPCLCIDPTLSLPPCLRSLPMLLVLHRPNPAPSQPMLQLLCTTWSHSSYLRLRLRRARCTLLVRLQKQASKQSFKECGCVHFPTGGAPQGTGDPDIDCSHTHITGSHLAGTQLSCDPHRCPLRALPPAAHLPAWQAC